MTRDKDPQQRATVLTRTGAAIMAVFTVLAGIVIVGDSLQDPGGNAGWLITLAWVVPMLILAVAAWFWPAPTAPLLLALASAFIAACVWLAFDPAALRSFVSENGPVIAVSVVALAFPAAVLGLKRTALAGWLLVALGVLPLLDHAHRKVRSGRHAHRGQRGPPDRGDQLPCRGPIGPRKHGTGRATGRCRLRTARYPAA